MSKIRKNHVSLARLKNNDWHIGESGMDKSEPNHSTRELNGLRVGRRRDGIVRYILSNKKGQPLNLEILHLLHNKEFVLKKGRHLEALENGHKLLKTWRKKGIVNAEGDAADVKMDLLMQGERIFI